MNKFNKILLIDDDSITNFLNVSVIKKSGITEQVKVTMNGDEALDYIKGECQQDNCFPDLILVDINMPVMDGFEFINQFRKLEIQGMKMPIIAMLTTSSDIRDISKTNELKVTMLKKPLTVNIVIELFGGEEISVKHQRIGDHKNT